ncbi:MAG: 5-oxoprolinase [Nisaea sp.]|nr:5-oxoprolinase [Nisaea sp.]OUX91348.1 MAG: 5-oxoprolinase [Candidatus Endolissoclinum sp. TMED26]
MSAQELGGLDRIRMQIQWNRLLSVVEEQAQTLMRTAFSTSTREAGDLSAGVFDTQGRMLAQAVTGTPGHVNAMAASVGFFLEKFPTEKMCDGDVLITNDPWQGTGHLNDFTVVTPAFHDGRLIALFASTSHVVDVGGRGFGPDGRQIYEEGLNVPMSYLAKAGEMSETLLEIVRANVRNPVEVEGDLYSLAACNEVGCRRLSAMMTEFALHDLDDLGNRIIDMSRAGMLAEIAKLPKGVFHNVMRIDGYERPLDLVATLTIGEDGFKIDFDGTSGVSSYGINVPVTYTEAYASFGIRCIIGGAIPNNAGSLSTIQVTAPVGSILNAPHPCAVTARHVIGQMLPDVVLGCLNQAIPNQVPAEGTSCLWNPVLLSGHGLTEDDSKIDDQPFAMNTFHAGGTGARPGKDGMSATAFPSGVRNTPIEVNETIAPLIFWKKEYRRDSGGAGEFRGGTGQVMEVAHAKGKDFAINAMFDRVDHPPRGRNGGDNGMAGKLYLESGTVLSGKGRQVIPAGDKLILEMPGGGGLGDPMTRPAEQVADDVLNGIVSAESAQQDYGVITDASGQLDVAATKAERDRRPAAE